MHVSTEAGAGGAAAAPDVGEELGGGAASELSPDRTPTNEAPSMPLQSGKFVLNIIIVRKNPYIKYV